MFNATPTSADALYPTKACPACLHQTLLIAAHCLPNNITKEAKMKISDFIKSFYVNLKRNIYQMISYF